MIRAAVALLLLAAAGAAQDILVIAPDGLAPALTAWRRHREAQGLAVAVRAPTDDLPALVRGLEGETRELLMAASQASLVEDAHAKGVARPDGPSELLSIPKPDSRRITAFAGERREQRVNRAVALRRLRMKLARSVRTRVHPQRHRPSELWQSRRQGKQISINPKHRDYPALLAEALDVIVARKFDVAGAAGVLGISMSQLAKLVRHDKHAFAQVNEGRVGRGLPALK